MGKLFAVGVACTSLGLVLGFHLRGGVPVALAGQVAEKCSTKNGDVNADGTVDIADAVTVLGNLFLGNPTALVPLCEVQGSSGLPDTGQRKCFNGSGEELNCNSIRFVPCLGGQDGFSHTGCPSAGRFTDHGDGTVTDHCTGLMWQKDTADVNDDGNSNDQDRTLWCDALAYCNNLSFAGHDDWRLPNVRELQSIVDYGQRNPAIDPVFSASSDAYWSSTSYTGNPVFGWYVNFLDGIAAFDLAVVDPNLVGGGILRAKGGNARVRAVRNAP